MKKSKPRWIKVRFYDLLVKKIRGDASPEESEAVKAAMSIREKKGIPEIFVVDGKFIVR